MPDKSKPHVIPILLLIVATIAVYAPSLTHDFLLNWDDNKYVTDNEAVRGFTPEHLKAAFSTYYVGNFAPLQIVSYMLDYTLWGMRAGGFIFTNILLHALNGLLYYLLLIRISRRRLLAFLASFIFLLHPVQVESVVWISQRKNVLAMFFFLVSFLLYVKYRDRGPETGDLEKKSDNPKFIVHNPKLLYAGSVAGFVLALLAKSAAVVLPPLLLLYDICFVAKERRGRWLADKLPYLATAGIMALVALKSQAPEFSGGRTGYHGGSPWTTFLTMLPVLMRYLGMLFWPANLSAVYNPPIRTGVDWAVALSALAVIGLCTAGYCLFRARKDLFFWGALFFIGLAPVSQVVPLVTLINDRYLYFPMLGSAAFLVAMTFSAVEKLPAPYRKGVAAALCLPLLILPPLSFKRAEVWHDSFTLWSDAVARDPANPVALRALGGAYQRIGRLEAALPYYQRALALDPFNADVLDNISCIYLNLGGFDQALPHILRLNEHHPRFANGYRSLGYYHFLTGDLPKAEAAFQKSLSLEPDSDFALRQLGHIYFRLGRAGLAREYYGKSIAAGGETAEVRFNLARLEAAAGNGGAALGHLEAALLLGFGDADAVEQSRELDPLRGAPEFRRLVKRYLRR